MKIVIFKYSPHPDLEDSVTPLLNKERGWGED
jgi:hypothetical protein